MEKKWYEKDFRRNLVDMHITAFDETFLSEFNPKKYVETVAKSNVNALLFYANSHVGYCNWPTNMGSKHPNLNGRDFVGDIINECKKRGIDVSLYYSIVFSNWAIETHPEWEAKKSNGEPIYGLNNPRYRIACLNNEEYRQFTKDQVQELCKAYDFKGIWYDMTFWPGICYCDSCKKRYKAETGKEIPLVVDWRDKEWIAFQRKREEWLNEFAAFTTKAVKDIKPDVTVTHQCASYLAGWSLGANIDFSYHTDFMAGDLYGNKYYQTFYSKLYDGLTENKPFEYMASRCVNLGNHTLSKEIVELEATALTAIANGGAFLFIDAIDPSGDVHPRTYEAMAEVNNIIEKVEPFLGGDMIFDTAIYHSTSSRIPLLQKGEADTIDTKLSLDYDLGAEKEFNPDIRTIVKKSLSNVPTNHSMLCTDISKVLIEHNIPFGVITKKTIDKLEDIKLLILPEVVVLDSEEIDKIKSFVSGGGKILATRNTSIYDPAGPLEGFGLEEVFGAKYAGNQPDLNSYMTPTSAGQELLNPYTKEMPLCIRLDFQTKVTLMEGAEVLATYTPPYGNQAEPLKFASIHSNPPVDTTNEPTIIRNKFGKGESIYITGNMNVRFAELSNVFCRLLDSMVDWNKQLITNAPKPVEITIFDHVANDNYLVHLVNFQETLPNIPVHDIEVTVRVEHEPKEVRLLMDGRKIKFDYSDGYVRFEIEELETYQLVSIKY